MGRKFPAKEELTFNELIEALHYCPKTGVFTRKERSIESFGGHIGSYTSWVKRYSGREVGGPSGHGYRLISIRHEKYMAHRLAWLYVHGEWPPGMIDHINHDGMDNRIDNLRLATYRDNNKNKEKYKNNTSGFTGVNWSCRINKWTVTIKTEGRVLYLGSFKNKDDAIKCRVAANDRYGFHENHGKNISSSAGHAQTT